MTMDDVTKGRHERANEIAESLRGTALSVSDVMTADEEDDIDLQDLVWEIVDLCIQCGWWCGVEDLEEVDGELKCNECREEDET